MSASFERKCNIFSIFRASNLVKILFSFPRLYHGGQGWRRCSRLFRCCWTLRSILPGQFRRFKNTRLIRRPYRRHRKSITPARRSVRWVSKKKKYVSRSCYPWRLVVARSGPLQRMELCQTFDSWLVHLTVWIVSLRESSIGNGNSCVQILNWLNSTIRGIFLRFYAVKFSCI